MKAYDCENRVFARRKQPMAMDDSVALANKLFAHFGVEPIVVRRTWQKGRSGSHFWHAHNDRPVFISLGSHAPDWIVCHEVAHYVAHCRAGSTTTNNDGKRTGHDKAWASIYVEAVRLAIGDTYADRLARAFAKAKLKVASR